MGRNYWGKSSKLNITVQFNNINSHLLLKENSTDLLLSEIKKYYYKPEYIFNGHPL